MTALPLAHARMFYPRLAEARWGEVHVALAMDLLAHIPDSSASLVILDLPERFGLDDFSVIHRPEEATPADQLLIELTPLAKECQRVLHEGGSTVLLGGATTYAAWEIAAGWVGLVASASLTVLWDRQESGGGDVRIGKRSRQRRQDKWLEARNSPIHPVTTLIRHHTKPGLRLPPATRMVLPSNVLICHTVPVDQRAIPTQRPIELFTYLLNILTEPLSYVVDPFCGSGSALIAASQLSRKWIGGDVNPKACEVAVRRLKRAEVGHEYIYTRPMYWWVAGDKRILVEG